MTESSIIQLTDLKQQFKTVLTPEKINSFTIESNLKQMAREHYMINDLLVTIFYNFQQINPTNQHVDKVITSVKNRLTTMEITREQFKACVKYLNFIGKLGYERFIEIHEAVLSELEGKNTLKTKLSFMGLNSKINEKELIKLFNDFLDIIVNDTYFPLNFMEQINELKKSNTKLSSFNETTFTVLNSIFLEHCLFEAKDAKKVNKIMESNLFASMLVLPENIVEKIRTNVMASGIITDFLNYGWKDEELAEIESALFGETSIDYVEPEPTETPENVDVENVENDAEKVEEKPLTESEQFSMETIEFIQEFYNISITDNSKGILDPNFILFNAIMEANDYNKYETKDKVIECINMIVEQKDDEKTKSYITQISYMLNQISKVKDIKDFHMKEFDINMYNNICVEEFSLPELIKTKFADLSKIIEEQQIISVNPIDASFLEKISPKIKALLEVSMFSHFDHKGIALSVLQNGVTESLSSYMNLIQTVELLENASVKGEDKLELFNSIYELIKTESVTLSFNVETLSKENVDLTNEEVSNLREYKVYDIFKGIGDITKSNHTTNSYIVLNKLFKDFR